MGKIENELDDLVYEQYGDKLDAKDKELETKDNQIKNLKKSNSEY